jgi:hypothetical protein
VKEGEEIPKMSIESKGILYFRCIYTSITDNNLLHVMAYPGSDKIAIHASLDQLYPNSEQNIWTTKNKTNEHSIICVCLLKIQCREGKLGSVCFEQ